MSNTNGSPKVLAGAIAKASDAYEVQIPFTGSGITLYILQPPFDPVNASIILDGDASSITTTTLFSDAEMSVNVSLYNVQSLPYGTHAANVSLLDYNRPGADKRSCLYFDFAAVNDTSLPTSTTSPSSLASNTPVSSSTTTAQVVRPVNKQVGAIIGGVVGGATAIVVVFLIIWARIKIRGRRKHANPYVGPKPALPESDTLDMGNTRERLYATAQVQPGAAISNPTDLVSAALPATHFDHLASARPTASSPLRPDPQARAPDVIPSSSMYIPSPRATDAAPASAARMVPAPSGFLSGGNTMEAAVLEPSLSDTPAQVPAHLSATMPNNLLTDEQINFVRSLWSADVPPADIAHIIERMKVENAGAFQSSSGGKRDSASAGRGQAPPQYDFVST